MWVQFPYWQSKEIYKMKYITMCGRPGACCPVLGIPEANEKYYTITDDYGGKVKLTKEQLYKLQGTVL